MLTKPQKTYLTTGNLKKNGERCFSAAVGVRCLSTDQSSGLETKRAEIFVIINLNQLLNLETLGTANFNRENSIRTSQRKNRVQIK